jgi:hypothetical protein
MCIGDRKQGLNQIAVFSLLSNEEAEAVEEMSGRIADKFLNDGR